MASLRSMHRLRAVLETLCLRVALPVLVAIVGVGIWVMRDDPARAPSGELRVLDARDPQIRYVLGGPAGGVMVPLLASYARSASDFNELAEALHASGYRTLALQARGIEGSALPSLRASLFDYADDLAAVLDAEQILSPVVVVGHAFGNRIARAFATRYPQRVDSLVLLAAGDSAPPPGMSGLMPRIVLRAWPEATRRSALQQAFFAPGNDAPVHWVQGWYPLAAVAQTHATATTPQAEWIRGGEVPMLVVQAAQDALAPGAAEALRQLFPQRVRVIVLEGVGHAMLPERPQEVAAIVLRHLRERESAGKGHAREQ